ncbi:cytidine deaminase [Reichenbachiella carrageenanivorans]|uniref:Cytidine deaminase n=1 Tax=Reichenbachiella carrageenanivorans TaxID=2979869 RepID=A0ABY6D0K2_9BACT|nr:cytidine deaminase [Reichenbachiella carrageenanivorans]UXX79628.1 cytidine deaminase [Reichenbachiella carrageenanivorans]
MAKKLTLHIEADLCDFDELSIVEQSLVLEAQQAVTQAYAPYSNFYVGAAVLLADDTVVKGSNQENAAYPSGLCAERVAIFSAGANHPRKEVKMVAIAARPKDAADYVMASSCGNCRQAMMEYESKQDKPIQLLFVCPSNEILKTTVGDLLPFGFDSKSLKG